MAATGEGLLQIFVLHPFLKIFFPSLYTLSKQNLHWLQLLGLQDICSQLLHILPDGKGLATLFATISFLLFLTGPLWEISAFLFFCAFTSKLFSSSMQSREKASTALGAGL